jgi:hypothetical protein
VRISLHNEKTSRTIFRTIEIVRPMQTLPPVAHEVQTVAAQNTIVVQPVATKAKNDLMCPPIGAKDSLLDMIAKLLTCWINTWFS